MKRPIKKDYLTTNQFEYHEKLNEYYDQLERYIDYCEQQLNLACVTISLPSDKKIETTVWEEIPIPLINDDRVFETDNYIKYMDAVRWAKWMRDTIKGNEW